jgi:N-acetylglutamate synthase-like GNAT family acetyltransferase
VSGPRIAVRRTTELAAVRRLGVANGLDDSQRGDEAVAAAWGAFDGHELVGAIVLERFGDLDGVNWLAGAEGYRRRGIAARLYACLEHEARARGVRRLWVTARTPAFFFAQGYVPVPVGRERAALLGDCPRCPQYGRGCEPQALCKDLDPAAG